MSWFLIFRFDIDKAECCQRKFLYSIKYFLIRIGFNHPNKFKTEAIYVFEEIRWFSLRNQSVKLNQFLLFGIR